MLRYRRQKVNKNFWTSEINLPAYNMALDQIVERCFVDVQIAFIHHIENINGFFDVSRFAICRQQTLK